MNSSESAADQDGSLYSRKPVVAALYVGVLGVAAVVGTLGNLVVMATWSSSQRWPWSTCPTSGGLLSPVSLCLTWSSPLSSIRWLWQVCPSRGIHNSYYILTTPTGSSVNNTQWNQILAQNRDFCLPNLHSTLPLRNSRQNIAMPLFVKLKWCGYRMFIRFDKIHERDGHKHTDRQTDTHTDTAYIYTADIGRACIASRGKNRHHFKYNNGPIESHIIMVYRTAPVSVTLNNSKPSFQGHAILWRWISHKRLKIQPLLL